MTIGAGFSRIHRFAAVDRPGSAGFRRGWQKHHLLPRQLFSNSGVSSMLAALGNAGLRFDDFVANGVLLPGSERAAIVARLPLHRGPHRIYNELVLGRVGTVEMEWSRNRTRHETQAENAALSRIRLIQAALKKRLAGEGKGTLVLNRRDPIGQGVDFGHLDAMADTLWNSTAPRS